MFLWLKKAKILSKNWFWTEKKRFWSKMVINGVSLALTNSPLFRYV